MPSSGRAGVTGRVVRTSRRTLSSETPVEQMRPTEQTQRSTRLRCVRLIAGAAVVRHRAERYHHRRYPHDIKRPGIEKVEPDNRTSRHATTRPRATTRSVPSGRAAETPRPAGEQQLPRIGRTEPGIGIATTATMRKRRFANGLTGEHAQRQRIQRPDLNEGKPAQAERRSTPTRRAAPGADIHQDIRPLRRRWKTWCMTSWSYTTFPRPPTLRRIPVWTLWTRGWTGTGTNLPPQPNRRREVAVRQGGQRQRGQGFG